MEIADGWMDGHSRSNKTAPAGRSSFWLAIIPIPTWDRDLLYYNDYGTAFEVRGNDSGGGYKGFLHSAVVSYEESYIM